MRVQAMNIACPLDTFIAAAPIIYAASNASTALPMEGYRLQNAPHETGPKKRGRKPGLQSTVSQRYAANSRERSRMRVLAKGFVDLKTVLPWVPKDTKLSKLDTLKLASGYIAYLKKILDDPDTSSTVYGDSLLGDFLKESIPKNDGIGEASFQCHGKPDETPRPQPASLTFYSANLGDYDTPIPVVGPPTSDLERQPWVSFNHQGHSQSAFSFYCPHRTPASTSTEAFFSDFSRIS